MLLGVSLENLELLSESSVRGLNTELERRTTINSLVFMLVRVKVNHLAPRRPRTIWINLKRNWASLGTTTGKLS